MWMNDPPFPRGESFKQGTAIDTVNDPFPGTNLEGKEVIFPDTIYGTGVPLKMRTVRNCTGGLLFPARLYSFDPTFPRQRLASLAILGNQRNVFPSDELLPSAGVQVNDLVYIVISGPALVYTQTGAVAGNVINPGDGLVAVTAASSGAADAGAAGVGGTVGSTAEANGMFGRAVTAATTANTNTPILVMVESRW